MTTTRRRVFGMVGATNVANETKEFKPAAVGPSSWFLWRR